MGKENIMQQALAYIAYAEKNGGDSRNFKFTPTRSSLYPFINTKEKADQFLWDLEFADIWSALKGDE